MTAKITENVENLRLIHRTVLVKAEKIANETSSGQNDAWTAKNGEVKIILS